MNHLSKDSIENQENYERLYTLGSEFLRVFRGTKPETYTIFTNRLFLTFVKKFYSGENSTQKIAQIKKQDQIKEYVFRSLLGILGFHLVIRQGKLEKEDFLKKYTTKLTSDNKFFESEIEKIFDSFSTYFTKLISQEKKLDTLTGGYASKIFKILSKTKTDFKPKTIDIYSLLEPRNYANGVEDIAQNGLLESSDSFYVALKLLSQKSQKLSLFQVFLLLHRRKDLTSLMNSYQTKLKEEDLFSRISCSKIIIYTDENMFQSSGNTTGENKEIGKYGKELEIVFLDENNIIDFSRFDKFISEYAIREGIQELLYQPSPIHHHGGQIITASIIRTLKSKIHAPYEYLVKLLETKNFEIRDFQDENHFDIELHLQKDVLLTISLASNVFHAKIYDQSLSICELEIDKTLGLEYRGEPKKLKELKRITGFFLQNHPFYTKLAPEHQPIFILRVVQGLCNLIADIQLSPPNTDKKYSHFISRFYTPYTIEFSSFEEYINTKIFKPLPVENISHDDIFLQILGFVALKMKNTPILNAQDLSGESENATYIGEINDLYINNLICSGAFSSSSTMPQYLQELLDQRAQTDFESKFLNNQKKLQYLSILSDKKKTKENLLKYIYTHADDLLSTFGNQNKKIKTLFSELLQDYKTEDFGMNLLILFIIDIFELTTLSSETYLSKILHWDHTQMSKLLISSFTNNNCLEANIIKDLANPTYKEAIQKKIFETFLAWKDKTEASPEVFIQLIGLANNLDFIGLKLDIKGLFSDYSDEDLLKYFSSTKKITLNDSLKEYFSNIIIPIWESGKREWFSLYSGYTEAISVRKKIQKKLEKIRRSTTNAKNPFKKDNTTDTNPLEVDEVNDTKEKDTDDTSTQEEIMLKNQQTELTEKIGKIRIKMNIVKQRNRLFITQNDVFPTINPLNSSNQLQNLSQGKKKVFYQSPPLIEFSLDLYEKKIKNESGAIEKESLENFGCIEKYDRYTKRIEDLYQLYLKISQGELTEEDLNESFIDKIIVTKGVAYYFYFYQYGYIQKYPIFGKLLLKKLCVYVNSKEYRRDFAESIYALLFRFGLIEENPDKLNPEVYHTINEIFQENLQFFKEEYYSRKMYAMRNS